MVRVVCSLLISSSLFVSLSIALSSCSDMDWSFSWVSLSWVLRSIILSLWVLSSLLIFSVVFSASLFCCVISFVDLSSSFSSSFICFFAVCS